MICYTCKNAYTITESINHNSYYCFNTNCKNDGSAIAIARNEDSRVLGYRFHFYENDNNYNISSNSYGTYFYNICKNNTYEPLIKLNKYLPIYIDKDLESQVEKHCKYLQKLVILK